MKARRGTTKTLVYVFLFVCVVVTLFPFAWMISSSFKPTGDVMSAPPRFFPETATLENYKIIFAANIGRNFVNSLFVSIIRTAVTVYSSALLGFVFAKYNFKGKEFMFAVFISTMMVPWIVTIIPLFNIFNKMNLLDTYLAIIATGLVSSYGIYMVRSFMHQIDSAFIESARIDGCSEFMIFNRIILPLSISSLAVLCIMNFLSSWDDFLWPLLTLTTESKFTLTVALSKFAFKHYVIEYGPVIAGSVISITPVVIVLILCQRNMLEGVALGGIKG